MGSHHVLLNRGDVRVWTGSLRMGRVAPTGGSLAMITLRSRNGTTNPLKLTLSQVTGSTMPPNE
jgi:hypothetical protein